jgi:ketosteroid isomerase-like protein
MSAENVEVVRRGFEYFEENLDFLPELNDPEFVWDMSNFRGWPEQKLYPGIDGAREFMRDWLDAWNDWSIEVESLSDAGDKVVAIVRQRGTSKTTGLPVDMTFAQVFTVRDGKQVRMEMYAEPSEGLEAAGLSGPEEDRG